MNNNINNWKEGPSFINISPVNNNLEGKFLFTPTPIPINNWKLNLKVNTNKVNTSTIFDFNIFYGIDKDHILFRVKPKTILDALNNNYPDFPDINDMHYDLKINNNEKIYLLEKTNFLQDTHIFTNIEDILCCYYGKKINVIIYKDFSCLQTIYTNDTETNKELYYGKLTKM